MAEGRPSSGPCEQQKRTKQVEDGTIDPATEPMPTKRGLSAQHKSRKARNNPQLLPMLVKKQHPDMNFCKCTCELTGGQTVVGFAEYRGELYLKLGTGLLEEDEVLSMADDVVGRLMGLEYRGPIPQRDPHNDKRIVSKHMVDKLRGRAKELLNGDGAMVEAFCDPPELRDYIQRRRKELWLGVKKPRISVFHARALIEEFTDTKKKFDWAGLKVYSLKKVMLDWGANANGGTTTNKEFLCEYVALALSLKSKWQEEKLRGEEEQGNSLPDKGKKRKLPNRAAEAGPEKGNKRLNDERRASLAETSLSGELRNQGNGSVVPYTLAGPGKNPSAAGTTVAQNSKEQPPPSANPERTKNSEEANHGSQPMPIAREVPNGGAGEAEETVPVNLANRREELRDLANRREELREEIANTKDLQAFAVHHFKIKLRELELELEKLGREETPPPGPPKIWLFEGFGD